MASSGSNAPGRTHGYRRSVSKSATVPGLSLDSKARGKAQAMNDEVAAILKGLNLDRNFFQSRLMPAEQAAERVMVHRAHEEEEPEHSGDSPTASATQASFAASHRKKEIELRRTNEKLKQNVDKNSKADFDIYLNESVMPVLAQSLDALCRQLHRMEEQGDNLDPKVRARFNPLTFMAQQLLRRHPKCARTPRRQALYKNFGEWADYERGRRALFRRKDIVQETFSGFVLASNAGGVQAASIQAVLDAIDDTLKLEGVLKTSQALVLQMGVPSAVQNLPSAQTLPAASGSGVKLATVQAAAMNLATMGLARRGKRRASFFHGDVWTFDHFWKQLSQALIKLDVVPYSVIERGALQIQRQLKDRMEHEEAERREAEFRKQEEIELQQLTQEYASQHEVLSSNEHIRAILDSNKILTGDDVRPGDAGYEFEVPPKGKHCALLAKFLTLLGFKDVQVCEKTEDGSEDMGGRWWTADLAGAWTVLQDLHGMQLTDGVVEAECLSQVLVEPIGFQLVYRKVQDELERLAEDGDESSSSRKRMRRKSFGPSSLEKKPSFETLCQRLGMTMARLQWLHQLFEGFLQTEDQELEEAVTCGYPENPAALKKDQMRELLMEVKPDIGDAEFEARFQRIDEDGSGEVEFDEFVTWVREDEVRIVGASSRKYDFPELAAMQNQKLELITYLHQVFQDGLPEGQVDDYPSNPVAMQKADVKTIVNFLSPDTTDAEFETNWRLVDITEKGCVDFDEFLDVLVMDDLPPELLSEAGVA